MESKAIPTVEEFISEYTDGDIDHLTGPYSLEITKELMQEYAVLFAKYHREQQLEATVNNFYTNYIGLKSKEYIKQDLENAYSESCIK